MTELYNAIKNVILACNQAEIRVSNESILENATRIYNTEFIQNSRKPQNAQLKEHNEPATEKQIGALKKMRISHDDDITKQQAFELIREKIESGKKD